MHNSFVCLDKAIKFRLNIINYKEYLIMSLDSFERRSHWITVADLTGVAIEDLQIAKTVYQNLLEKNHLSIV
jgi:hypothetical protein